VPDLSVVSQEKTIQNIEGFDKNKLKHAETAEKVVPPSQSTLIFVVGMMIVVHGCSVHSLSCKILSFSCKTLKTLQT